MRKETADLWNLVEPHVRGAGLDLIELNWGQEPGGWVMRVFIDRLPEDGPRLPADAVGSVDPLFPSATITHQECERVSRDLSAALDVSNAIPHAYHLEVSSPGLDRPLRRLQDFRRFAGQKIKVRTTDAVDGRRNFSGVLRDAHDGVVEIECEGRSYQVPVDAVARAHLVPDWAGELKKSRSAL